MDVRVFDLIEEHYPKNDPNVAGRLHSQALNLFRLKPCWSI